MNNGHDTSFKELLSAYYGGQYTRRKQKKKAVQTNMVTFSKVFDNNDNLVQLESPPFEEYVVMQSRPQPKEMYEEYVVQSSVPEEENFEEYVVRSGETATGVTDLYAVSSSVQETDVLPAEEYRVDLSGHFSDAFPNDQPAEPGKPEQPAYRTTDNAPAVSSGTSKEMSQPAGRDNEFEEDFQASTER